MPLESAELSCASGATSLSGGDTNNGFDFDGDAER
jgi:hypothetical protein